MAQPSVAGALPRLVLVLGPTQHTGALEVALVHASPELATSMDGVIPAALAGTRYDVVVQADLRAVLWRRQLGSPVGRLAPGVLAELNELLASGGRQGRRGVHLGLPLVGPWERRWGFKREEGRALDELSQDCTRARVRPLRLLSNERVIAQAAGRGRKPANGAGS